MPVIFVDVIKQSETDMPEPEVIKREHFLEFVP